MNAVIIDDNKISCLNLRDKLMERDDIKVYGVAFNGFDGLDLINKTKPDVIFLDVELPDISGLDFIERSTYIKESECRIVMYTAYDKYILPALRKRVFDVLIKPFEDSELEGVMTRLKEPRPENDPDAAKKGNNSKINEKDDPRYVLFTNSVDFTIIGKGDIGIFQYDASSRCWEAVVSGIDHPVRLRRNVRREDLFKLGQQYVQVHQKYIINIDYLINVVNSQCHFFPPFEKIDYVTVGRVYKEKLLKKFLSL